MSLSSFDLGGLSRNEEGFTIEEFITSLQATTTLKDLNVRFDGFTVKSTPEINRLFIEPLCRCITNLRCHNQNHPLRTLHIIGANEDVCHSLVEFGRDNTHLKVLTTQITNLSNAESTSTIAVPVQDGPQDSSVLLTLDELLIQSIMFQNATVASQFLNFIAHHSTYPALGLGEITVYSSNDHVHEEEEEQKIARRRGIVSALLQPSVQQLTLYAGCRPEVMDVMEACTTVTQIQLDDRFPPFEHRSDAVQAKAAGNRDAKPRVGSVRGPPSGISRPRLADAHAPVGQSSHRALQAGLRFSWDPCIFQDP